ncbi:MAG: ABC transporter ATP-binding protein [Candidatus Tectimicrobiota bacterium]
MPTGYTQLAVFMRPYRCFAVLVMLCLLAESAVSLAIPWFAGQFLPALVQTNTAASINLKVHMLMLLGLCVLQALCGWSIFYLSSHIAEHLLVDMRTYLYDHLQRLPLHFHYQRSRGDLLTLLTQDVEVISWCLSGSLLGMAPLLLTSLGAIACMLALDLRLGLLSTLTILSGFGLLKILGRHIRALSTHVTAAQARAAAIAEDQLRVLPVIKAFTRESSASKRYREQLGRTMALVERQLLARSVLGPLMQLLTLTGIVLLLWYAGERAMTGTLAPETLIRFLLYGLFLVRPLNALAAAYGHLQQARGAMARIIDVLQGTPEPQGHRPHPPGSVVGIIAFHDIHFAYPGRAPILTHLCLRIDAGEILVLTGPNGAGKSTLAHLLMRFYVPQAGHICIDGHDIRTFPLAYLRQQIGFVPQQPFLLHGTIYDNLAYGKPAATQKELEAAARVARAHAFISRLPEGYQTRLGDHGVHLSGGEQQRLALARALLKDPPILIFDEAMAMYDPEGEQELLLALREVLRRRTVLLITHQPAPLVLADRIVRLAAGHIEEVLPAQPRQGLTHVRS